MSDRRRSAYSPILEFFDAGLLVYIHNGRIAVRRATKASDQDDARDAARPRTMFVTAYLVAPLVRFAESPLWFVRPERRPPRALAIGVVYLGIAGIVIVSAFICCPG